MADKHATLYDFRDIDIMYRLAEESTNGGVGAREFAELLGFDEGDTRSITIRLAWMKRYGMVAFDDKERLWTLSESGRKVTAAHLRAPALRTVEQIPDEAMIEVMAQVTSRYQRGEPMLAHMLRREFMYGTKRR